MTEQEKIKKALSGLRASGDTVTEVLNMANEASSGKRFTGKRAAIIAAVAVLALALGVGALASSGIIGSWSSGSSLADAYTALPTAEQAKRDGGFVPALIGEFKNGYAFAGGTVVGNVLEEELGSGAIERFKSFSFEYEKDGDRAYLDQMRYESKMEDGGEVIATIDGIDIRYNSYRNRFVAPDYELTPEEQAARDAGELVFSFGEEIPGVRVVQSAIWSDGNMHYCLLQIDGALSPEELVEMAAEVIANG